MFSTRLRSVLRANLLLLKLCRQLARYCNDNLSFLTNPEVRIKNLKTPPHFRIFGRTLSASDQYTSSPLYVLLKLMCPLKKSQVVFTKHHQTFLLGCCHAKERATRDTVSGKEGLVVAPFHDWFFWRGIAVKLLS